MGISKKTPFAVGTLQTKVVKYCRSHLMGTYFPCALYSRHRPLQAVLAGARKAAPRGIAGILRREGVTAVPASGPRTGRGPHDRI
eukprot:gene16335-biopygen3763